VLVVEDNEVVAQAVAAGLRDQGIAVDVAATARPGWTRPGSGRTTLSCSTATCRGCTGTMSAHSWPGARAAPGS
jgi:hypothetical protein